MASNVEEQDAEPPELLSEAQKAARDADLDARLEKLKMEVNQEPLHIPNPETVKATEELLERLAALRQEHAAATATADAFRKSIAKLPEKCSIEELKAKFKEGAAEAPETISYGDHASQYCRVHRPSCLTSRSHWARMSPCPWRRRAGARERARGRPSCYWPARNSRSAGE